MRTALIESLEVRQFLSGTPSPVAGPKGPGVNADLVQQRSHDRLRDGSCQTSASSTTSASQASAADAGTQDQIRQRLRDGTCKT
jgi:hypothetical protein